MSESSQEGLSRRNFLKVFTIGAGAGFLGKKIEGAEKQNLSLNYESLAPNEVVIANSEIELKASYASGIIDIVDPKTKRLINNLVVLVSWQDEAGIHYNNSEIQANQILGSRQDTSDLIYEFSNQEVSPYEHPASGLKVKMHLVDNGDTISLKPEVQQNPNNLNDIKIGIGCFFGINQGVSIAEVLHNNQQQEVTPNPNSATAIGQLGTFERFEDSQGFTLQSAYPETPSISLLLESSENGIVDIESRNVPYNKDHQALHENYIEQSGQVNWIEAAILYAEPGQVSTLSLS